MSEPIAAQRAGAPGASGCVVIVVALVGSIAWAVLQPWYGGPGIASVIAIGALYARRLARHERDAAARRLAQLRTIAAPSGDAWRTLFEREGLGHLVEHVAPLVRRAIRIETRADADRTVVASRIGGSPDLPEDVAWPTCDGRPLAFVAQLALAEVRAADPGAPLPDHGQLWFFHDVQAGARAATDDASAAILYRPRGAPLVRRPHPGGEPFVACAVAFAAYDDIPDLVETVPALAAVGEAEAERYFELRDYLSSGGGGAQHKLLGWSDPVQGDVESESGLGDEARLLLQLDSDDHAKMMWGDLGKLYFLISRRELAAARFDDVRVVEQCH